MPQMILTASCRSMWIAPILSTAVLTYLLISRPGALYAALPVLVLWFASPFITWWVSRPVVKEGITLKDEQIIFLEKSSPQNLVVF